MSELDKLLKVVRIAVILFITLIVLRICVGLFLTSSILSNNDDGKLIYETNLDWYKDKPHSK